MILWCILAEAFYSVDDLGAVLYLVKDDRRLFRHDLLAAGQHQVLQKAVNVFGCFKELLVFLVFIKVEIGSIFVISPAKLLQDPRFADLSHPLEYQRLTIGRVFPFQQFFQNKAFHGHLYHIFIAISVYEKSHFYYIRPMLPPKKRYIRIFLFAISNALIWQPILVNTQLLFKLDYMTFLLPK